MPWGNRYIPYVRWAKLFPVAWLIGHGLSVFNAAAMTTLVDRWRPETHSFHLLCGKMTVTLEDVAMILALPIRGQTMTYRVDPAGWHERVTAFLGRPPPPRPDDRKGHEAGLHISWLQQEFGICPDNANVETVSYQVRAWVWHMFATMLFPDGTGDMALWMYIQCLADWDEAGSFSWGSVVLAYLYRQLYEACWRKARSSNLGGCMYLLNVRSTDITLITVHVSMNNLLTCDIFSVASQVWSWLRIPVGCPRLKTPRVVDQANMEDLRPTAAYLWDHVSPPVRVTE
jgi:hypothetical protein